MFNNKTLLITGGTGSFGNAALKRFISTELREIRIFNHDEKNRMICARSIIILN
jgi:UDP-N-acetylglucosamine 4,6-dehydratase/5-epimerase